AFILWIVVAAFIATIVFDWGMGGFKGMKDIRSQGIIAKINGIDIKYSELKNIEDSYVKSADQKDFSGVKVAEMRQKAWTDFVKMIVIRQELEKQNIVVSGNQLYDEIINNPIPELKNSKEFMTDGIFDQAKYEAFIKNPSPQYEQYYKAIEKAYEGRIPGMLLESRVGNSAYLSEFELLNIYRESNLKVKVKYLKAETNSFMPADSLITDKEIEDYFKANPNEFPKQNEQRNFDFVLFGTDPTAQDSALVLDDINYAMTQLNNGISFEEVAINYSDDQSAKNGGDLGFFGKGKMVAEFEEAAFNAKVGELVGPIRTQYGYHIIKVTDQKKEKNKVIEIKASHILVKFKTYQSTYEDAHYSAVNFRDEAYRNGNDAASFTKTAGNLGVKINESPFTQQTDRTNELGIIPGLGDFLFKNEIGTVSPIMVSNSGYAILIVKEIKPERLKTLDEVKKSIIYKLRQKKGLDLALNKLEEIKSSVTDTLTMNNVAAENKMKTGMSGKFAVDGYVDNVGVDRMMYEIALGMDIGKVSEPFKGTQGAYIIYLLEKDNFNQEVYDSQKKALREKHEVNLQRQMIQEWLDGLVEKAEVTDYRGLYR
ncbi:MAG: peptidylprolyl isomerase, partial [Candidatus Delongbacteria bacterium]|nr:peptidylprolyl isomerase [Candidatus Delongbacteria bacterium]